MAAETYDAIIIGGGHNGLVAGFYLARAGLSTLILERRPFVGGACNTEEFAPGFRASTGAYVLSMLREAIWQRHAARPAGHRRGSGRPDAQSVPRRRPLLPRRRHGGQRRGDEALLRRRRAPRCRVFERDLGRDGAGRDPLVQLDRARSPAARRSRICASSRAGAASAFRQRKRLADLAFLFSTSATQLLSERFESEHVKAALGWHAINDSVAGPSTPGTAYVLLHDHASEEAEGGVRQWGFVRGGMGRLDRGHGRRRAGGGLHDPMRSRRRARASRRGGRAIGVQLADGEEIRAAACSRTRIPSARS